MSSLVGHFSSAIAGVREAHMLDMKKIFQKKLIKELEGISAAVKAQVDKEK